MKEQFVQFDEKVIAFMRKYGITFLRISVGIIFFWFGILKFFPNVSSAEGIATETISKLTFGLLPANISLFILAAWETIIGIGLIIGKYLRLILFLLFAQMIGTLTPLLIFPTETFKMFPFVPTLEGQYIIKNLILISAGLVLGSTVNEKSKINQ